jgi:dihydrolipoamide dehydrogenase
VAPACTRLHPDQGAAARGRGRRHGARGRPGSACGPRSVGHRHGRRQRRTRTGSSPALQGPSVGLVSARQITTTSRVPARLIGPTHGHRRGPGAHRSHIVLATGSYPRTLPGPRDRRAHHDQRRGPAPRPRPRVASSCSAVASSVSSSPRVWRSFGAEVTIVEALPARRRRGPGRRKVGARLPQARDHRLDRTRSSRWTPPTQGVRVRLEDGTHRGRPAARRRRARTVTDGHGFRGAGVAMERGFVTTDERLRTNRRRRVRRRRHRARAAAGPSRLPARDLRRRGHRRARTRLPVDDVHPRVTYCDPEIASVGLTEARRARRTATRHHVTYNLGGNGKSQILGTSGLREARRRTDGPVLGIHMVGDRVGEQIGEAQLIVGWEAHPRMSPP